MSEHETMTKQTEGDQEMNAPVNIKSPMIELKSALKRQLPEWKVALPPHIDPEHFERVAWTYIQSSKNLVGVDRRSLIKALTESAQDGLLPDGKESAIVIYGGRAVYQPGYRGLMKLARNSGELATIVARVVFEGDRYRYWCDETGEHLIYEPCDDPGRPLRVFCLARTKDGELFVEPMSVKEIEKVRAVAPEGQNPRGAWVNWWEEMAKKTAIKRLMKRFPKSADRESERLERAIERDDALYAASDKAKPVKAVEIPNDEPTPKQLRSLEDFGNGHGKKPEPEKPARSRGRPKKVEPTPEPEEPEWLANYREDLAQCETADEVQDSWDAIRDDWEIASEALKSLASDLYDSHMNRVNPEPDSYA